MREGQFSTIPYQDGRANAHLTPPKPVAAAPKPVTAAPKPVTAAPKSVTTAPIYYTDGRANPHLPTKPVAAAPKPSPAVQPGWTAPVPAGVVKTLMPPLSQGASPMPLQPPPATPSAPPPPFQTPRPAPVSSPPATSIPIPGYPQAPASVSADPVSATSERYTAAPYVVDPVTGTVQGQMNTLLDRGGEYLRRGETEGLQKAAERGLLNSSLAVGAAQGAMIDRALPIAQADAGFFDKAMSNTGNAINAQRQFDAQQANQVALENAKNATQINALNAQEANKLAGMQLDSDTRYSLGLLDAGTKERLMQFDNDTKLLLQTNAAASDMYSNTVKNIADITRDPSLKADAKQAAVDNQLKMLNQGLQQLQAVSSADSPQDINLQNFFTKKGQVARMTPQQQLDERTRLTNAVKATKADTVQRRAAVDALNEYNAILAEVKANPNLANLNLAEGF